MCLLKHGKKITARYDVSDLYTKGTTDLGQFFQRIEKQAGIHKVSQLKVKISSQVKSEDFVIFTGRSSTSQNLVTSLSRDLSTVWEIGVEKAELLLSLGAGTGPQMFGRVPVDDRITDVI